MSDTVLAAAGVVAVIVIGAATIWATFFVASTKRRITYAVVEDTPLLAAPTALEQRDLAITYRPGQLDETPVVLAAPRVVTLRVVSRGRKDIGSDDFDEGRSLAIDLGVSIVKRLTTSTDPKMPDSAFESSGTRLRIGPCLIRRARSCLLRFSSTAVDPN